MKKAKKDEPGVNACAERDRLWKSFLVASKEWNLQQDKMAKDLRRDGKIHPNVREIQAIQGRIESSHRLFAEHIEEHACSTPSADTTELQKKSIVKRK